MRTFTRKKTYDELAAECERRGWAFHSKRHDDPKIGSDFVTVEFFAKDRAGTMLVSMFNGKFFGDLADGTHFNSDESTLDAAPWFQELLEAVYV
jgi:hypothetical protein